MKITKPKFKLKDTVFFLDNNSVFQETILRIEIQESVMNEFNGKHSSITYHLGDMPIVLESGFSLRYRKRKNVTTYKKTENEVFKTKAELLKSL